MRVGICGVGNMGINHLRVCKKLERSSTDFKICAIYDPKIRKYNNKEIFLSEVEHLDAVIICAPSDRHVEIALELFDVKRDLKLLIEKPIDDDVEKAELLIPHEQKIFVGHIERFNPAVKKVKSLIDEGKITDISLVRTRRLSNFTARSSQYVNLDLLIHDVDIVNFLLQAPMSKKTIFKSQTKSDGKTDHAILTCSYNNSQKTVLISEVSWIEPEKI